MDVVTLSLAKKYANKVAAGFSNVKVQGNNLIFTLNDGQKVTMTIPTPENGSDGVSVIDLSIDTDGSLLCHMSDGSTIDAGKVPTIEPEHVQADWNQNDETQPDYIKNRICYSEGITTNEVVILERASRQFTSVDYGGDVGEFGEYYFSNEEENIISDLKGKSGILRFTLGETVSEETVENLDEQMNVSFYLDGIPFIVTSDMIGLPQYPSSKYYDISLTFITTEENIIKLPEKYLPDTVATKEYVNNNTPEQIQSDWNQNDSTQPDYIKHRVCYVDYFADTLIDDQTFTFIKNPSEQYICKFTEAEKLEPFEYETNGEFIFNGVKYRAVRNYLIESDMYSGYYVNADGVMIYIFEDQIIIDGYSSDSDSADITITFSLLEEDIVKLPEKYLPETIATKQYVDDMFNSIVNGDEVGY